MKKWQMPALLVFFLPAAVLGAESSVTFDVWFAQRFTWQENFLNTEGSITTSSGNLRYESPYNLRFNKDQTGYSFFLGTGLEAKLGRGLKLRGFFDSGEIKYDEFWYYDPPADCGSGDPRCGWMSNGRDITEEARATFFVRELFLSQRLGQEGEFEWWAGKKRFSAGAGAVIDNYVLGAGGEVELGEAWRVSAAAVFPNGEFNAEGKHSPFVWLEGAWQFSLLEELSFWAAYFHDGDDAVAELLFYGLFDLLLATGYVPEKATSRGDFFWLGVQVQKLFEHWGFTLGGAFQFGRADVSMTLRSLLGGQLIQREGALEVYAGMAEASAFFDLADWATAGLFFLYLSGQSGARQEVGGHFTSFIGIYPYITRTNVFFSGGMNQNFSARHISSSGVNARGVLAPGLNLGLDITSNLLLRFCGAMLLAQGEHPQSHSRFYGLEGDLNLEWAVASWGRLLLEFDYFHTGGFFDFRKPLERPDYLRSFASEPDAWKAMLGFDITF